MQRTPWFDRKFAFGAGPDMLPYFLERLGGAVARAEEKVKGVSDARLSEKVDGKWSVKENIAHLMEVCRVNDMRIKELKQASPELSPAVLQLSKDYNGMDIQTVIDLFREARRKTIFAYESLNETELKNAGVHPRLKIPLTAVDLAMFDAEHDDHHLVRVSEILKKTI